MDKVYMKLTRDKYQLPVAIAGSAKELATLCGTSEICVISSVSKWKHGKIKNPTYITVDIEEDTDE